VNIESAWSPVIPLAEHIAIEIGHVDPDVRLILTYEDEGPNFVGVTTFDADGINTFNDLDWDDLRETVIHNHEEIRERWDAEECDWHEGQEDEGEDMMSEVIWETASDWQHENIEWS
jgi:hypothetical protein